MKDIKVYTDIDTLFDTRRGTIEHVVKESGIKNFNWSLYEQFYLNRNIDYFDKPEYGITNERYLERFSLRNIDDWVDETYCYYYPTNVISVMLPIIRSVEIGSNNAMNIANINLTINAYPFVMSDYLKEQLILHVKSFFKVKIEVNIVYIGFNAQTADYINAFDYVFRYGHLINKELIKWYETYESCKRVGVKIIVPDLLAKPPKEDELLKELNNDSIKSRIEKMSSIQGGKSIFIPLNKSVFDYSLDVTN